MKKLTIIILSFSLILMGCYSTRIFLLFNHQFPKYIRCDDCYNREKVTEAVNPIATKFFAIYFKEDKDKYSLFIDEDEKNIHLRYHNLHISDNTYIESSPDLEKEVTIISDDRKYDLNIVISKKDCKVVSIKAY